MAGELGHDSQRILHLHPATGGLWTYRFWELERDNSKRVDGLICRDLRLGHCVRWHLRGRLLHS